MNYGFSFQYVRYFESGEVSTTAWKEKKTVCLLPTNDKELPKGNGGRFDRKTKNKHLLF